MVEDIVITEIKALESIARVHKKQLPIYLKLADKRLGLLIHFNVVLIQRRITPCQNTAWTAGLVAVLLAS